ncbi:PadR family transcriptional regulator [Gulosibacter sp. ACHW.36C]|uniref:PadR family transcriptional regulator n=1 Tax=Gulosibacter sediminis TaxID=1729695 RepID=A0ABY4MUN3_9MICO|nr:PadR family transcriptional regulator [Gulosibacter sediminis]UQN14094.1 PadR family transcriptional regulator [Gulosibacter sediminis]
MSVELQHAILGLLSLRPMSGYDLGRAFAGSVAHFWHADQSQIYRTLGRLDKAGLIDTTLIPQTGKPDRKEHTITDAGRDELERWLRSPLETEQAKEPFLARLFFAAPLGAQAVLALLDERRAQAEDLIASLRAIPTHGDDLAARLRTATLRNGIAQAEAELTWLNELTIELTNDGTSA